MEIRNIVVVGLVESFKDVEKLTKGGYIAYGKVNPITRKPIIEVRKGKSIINDRRIVIKE